jgi:hypothetical protein
VWKPLDRFVRIEDAGSVDISRRRRADYRHHDANDRQAAAPRPVSGQVRTEERDLDAFGATIPGATVGRTLTFAAVIFSASGGRLDHAYLPNFTDLVRDIAIL